MLITAYLAVVGSAAATSTCTEGDCLVTGYGANERSLWLPNLPGGVHQDFRFDEHEGRFEVLPDGKARISARCVNMQNPEYGFDMVFHFKERRDWPEWSALGRGWKGSPAIVQNHYLNWDYYILDDEQANTLVGFGLFEGSTLSITHMPADYHYGLQVGIAANDKNGEQGLSFWFNYSGTINGAEVSGHGDINLEGGCNEVAILECPIDLVVECEEGANVPEITGVPVINCQEPIALSYTDQSSGFDCALNIARTWIAINSVGDSMTCVQNITVVDTQPPIIETLPPTLIDCDFEGVINNYISDNCSSLLESTIEVVSSDVIGSGEGCDPGQLRTQTIGGWGAPASGNNPGAYRDAHFDAAFPNGLTIGCSNTLTLTSSAAVQAYLPAGGPSAILPAGSIIDPDPALANTFASQLIGITLSIGFDEYDPAFGDSDFALAEVVYLDGAFAGMTLGEVVEIANQVIGGCSVAYPIGALNAALTAANENYVDGTQNNGAFGCGDEVECGLSIDVLITATDACGNTSSSTQTVHVAIDDDVAFVNPPGNITVECGDIPEPLIELSSPCADEWLDVEVEELYFSGACQPTIQRTYSVALPCGTVLTHTHFITVVDTAPPSVISQPDDLILTCGELIPDTEPVFEDQCGTVTVTMTEVSDLVGCNEFIIRSWSANDLCGNSTSVQQTILIQPVETLDVISGPGDLTVGCGTPVDLEAPVFAEGCFGLPLVTYSESFEEVGCEQVLLRIWSATDGCGNEAVYQQLVSFIDTVAPSFTFVPADLVLNCGDDFEPLMAVAIDECSDVLVTAEDIVDAQANSCHQIIRRFTAVDACGNTAVAEQLIVFIDQEAPVIVGLPEQLDDFCQPALFSEVTAMDACDGELPVVFQSDLTVNDCAVTLNLTWSATDQCGNTATEARTFSYTDSGLPTFAGDAQLSISCDAFSALETVPVYDECVVLLTLTYSDEVIVNQYCEQTIKRTYVAIDPCGNQVEFVQMIQVTDDSPPVFTEAPQDVVIGCNDPLPEPAAVANDLCSEVTLTFTDEYVMTDCGERITRTFVATDACGNAEFHVQLIDRVDVDAPVFSMQPNDLVIGCGDALPEPLVLSAVDDCSAVEVFFEEALSMTTCGGDQWVRTWTAIDACGNAASVSQTISIEDHHAPTLLNVPGDLTAECGAVPEPALVTATDDCSDVTLTFVETTDSGGCPNIYRTWTATDGCGNSTSHTQVITLDDNEPPVITGIPPSITASCNNLPPIPEPEVSDNCDENVDVAFVETIVGSGCTFTIVRSWIASDDCGNTTVISQSIVVEDTEPPVFVDVPPVQIVECSALDGLPLPQVTDDCGNTVSITFEDEAFGSGCNYELLRTYTATDLCGNTATATTLINIVDETPPLIIGVGPNALVSCGQIPIDDQVYAIDNCSDEVTLTISDQTMGSGCDYIISRTYRATDGCGNVREVTRLIAVSDTEGPVLSNVPESEVFDCHDALPDAPEVTAFDVCSGIVPVNFSEFTEQVACDLITTRIWSATDECGNATTAIQTLVITDLTPPAFIQVPPDRTVHCSAIPAPEEAQAVDACGSVSITLDEEFMLGGCPYELHRIYTATDDCGNTAVHTQVLFVVDNEPPQLTGVLDDLTVGCGQIPDASEVQAVDNCSGVELYVYETTTTSGCTQLLVRSIEAVDACGNTTVHVQHITIVDDSPPVFEDVPDDLTTNCMMVPPMVNLTVTDDCGVTETSMEEFISEGACASEYTLTRVWYASDGCGNEAVAVQQITVIDDIAPVLVGIENDLIVGCGELPEPPEITAVSGCGEEINIAFTEHIIDAQAGSYDCPVQNAIGFSGDIALWLPGIEGIGENYVYGQEGGSFTIDETTGEALLTGTVYNKLNPDFSWYIELALHEQRDWASWSSLGRDYKDDLNHAQAFYQDWSYYVLNGAQSRLIGLGSFTGSELHLMHAPADTLFGFQLGMNANNHGEGYGLGGWFFYEGNLLDQQVAGHGDFFTLQECCKEQYIVRTWVATDCAGNSTTHTQTIHVLPGMGLMPYTFEPSPRENAGAFEVTGSMGDVFFIDLKPDYSGTTRIDLFDQHGRCVAHLGERSVIKGAHYKFQYPKAGLAPGMYVFMATGDRRMMSAREFVFH